MHGFCSLGSRSGRPDAEEQETDIQKIKKEDYIWKVCVLGLFISYRDRKHTALKLCGAWSIER